MKTRRDLARQAVVRCLAIAALLLMQSMHLSCFRHQTKIVLNTEVKDEQDRPIEGAEVFFDGRIFGFTDQSGRLNGFREVYGAREVEVVIRKRDGQSYYSEFRQKIAVQGLAEEVVGISARMFQVEKQQPPADQSSIPASPAPVQSSSSQMSLDSSVNIETETPPNSVNNSDSQLAINPEQILAPVQLSLSSSPQDAAKPKANAKFPEQFRHPERKKLTINIYVEGDKKLLTGAAVRYLVEGDTEFSDGCRTNSRGRCAINLGVPPGTQVRLIVSAEGFLTQARQIRLTEKMRERFRLKETKGMDLFVLRPSYGSLHAIAGAEILVEGEKRGVTDKYGHFILGFAANQSPKDLIEIRVPGSLPEKVEFETGEIDGVVSQIFRRSMSELPRVALLSTRFIDRSENQKPTVNSQIHTLVKKNVFRRGMLQQRNFVEIERAAEFADKSFSEVMRSGWRELQANIDFVIEPRLFASQKQAYLELVATDASGEMVAGSATEIELGRDDYRQLDQQIALLADRLVEALPFELTIQTATSTHVRVVVPPKFKDLLRNGDRLRLYGDSRKKLSDPLQMVEKGIAVVEGFDAGLAKMRILSRTDSAEVRPGDLAKIGHARPTEQSVRQRELVVKSSFDKSVVSGASVYWNDKWVGSTNAEGRFVPSGAMSSGQILVIDARHQPFKNLVNFASQPRIVAELQARHRYFQVDSEPRGAEVWLDGNAVGTTPLSFSVPVSVNQSNELIIKGPNGYRVARQVFADLHSDIDLTGSKRVVLEKDILKGATALIADGHFQEALTKLESVDELHSDFVTAQNEIGKIYLNQLAKPDLALKAYQRITQTPGADDFTDPRYAAIQLNQSIAHFMRGQARLVTDTAEAARDFREASARLKIVTLHVEDFSEDLREMAAHAASFYSAMSAQRLAEISGSESERTQAIELWKSYSMLTERSAPSRDETKAMFKAAEAYLSELRRSPNGQNELSH